MTTNTFERLLLFVSLPMICWSSRVMFDLAPEGGKPDSRTIAAFPSAASRPLSGGIRLTAGNPATAAANRMNSGESFNIEGAITSELQAPALPGGVEDGRSDTGRSNVSPPYANALSFGTLTLLPNSSISTYGLATNVTTGGRSKLPSIDRRASAITPSVPKTSALSRKISLEVND